MASFFPSWHGPNKIHVHRTWKTCAATLFVTGALTAAVCAQSVQSPPVPPAPQQSQPAPSQSTHPPLRVVRQMIQVDVVAKDRDGRPVANLRQSDFKLYDEGKLQQIAWFSPETKESRTQEAQLRTLPPRTFTNQIEQESGVPGNVTILLLDYLNTPAQDILFARNQLTKLLHQMQPNDRVALYALAGRLYVLHDFTSDMPSLLRAVDKYWTPPSVDAATTAELHSVFTGNIDDDAFANLANQRFSDFANINRVKSTTDAFEAIAQHMMRILGRKNLVWISDSFPFSIGLDVEGRDSSNSAYEANGSPFLMGSGGALSTSLGQAGDTSPNSATARSEGLYIQENRNFSAEIDQAVRALGGANIAIYPVDARGLIGALGTDPDFNAQQPMGPMTNQAQGYTLQKFATSFDTMNSLASRTGGHAYYNTNDIEGSVKNAMDDARVSYMLSYYPEHDDWKGKFHRIRVTVNRPGVSLQYRSGYFAQPPDYVENLRPDLVWRTALSSPLDATGVGVSVHVEPKEAAEARTMVMEVVVNESDVSFGHEGDRTTGRLEVVLAQYDHEGNIVASETSEVRMDLTRDTYTKARKAGLHFGRILPISGKTVEVRVFVRDTKSNAMGSISIPVNLVFQPKTN